MNDLSVANDLRKKVNVFFYVLDQEYKERLFSVDASLIVECPRFRQIDFTGNLRGEFIEDSSTEDNLCFIGDNSLINQFIDDINPLYQPAQADHSSHDTFLKNGGEWKDGDFVFFITLDAQGKWVMSGGEYSPSKKFH